ncbi:MAG: hypothetical protein II937_12030 [Bacteroidales bacterium]|nr:hypothetical protein [Bacteroidales bacterium]
MTYYKSNIRRKKPSILKWVIYAAVLVGVLFLFIPKYLIHKASNAIKEEITDTTQLAQKPPTKKIMSAYNYYQVAKFFPLGEEEGIKGQKYILDYYYPLFKKDYDKMKIACIDNAISELNRKNNIPKDSVNIKAIESEWKNYPEPQAVNDFLDNWEFYHKKYQKELEGYYRFARIKNN